MKLTKQAWVMSCDSVAFGDPTPGGAEGWSRTDWIFLNTLGVLVSSAMITLWASAADRPRTLWGHSSSGYDVIRFRAKLVGTGSSPTYTDLRSGGKFGVSCDRFGVKFRVKLCQVRGQG